MPIVYASTSLALAAIELFVHLEPNQQPNDLVSIAALLPEGEPAQRLEPNRLPAGWWTDDLEPLRALGDGWIREKSSLAIEVPSAALRTEWNVLVNPLHPRVNELRVDSPQPFVFDARMFQQKGESEDLEEIDIAFADVTAASEAGALHVRVPRLLVALGLAASNAEANRKLSEKAVKVNGEVAANNVLTLDTLPARLTVRLGKRARIAVIGGVGEGV